MRSSEERLNDLTRQKEHTLFYISLLDKISRSLMFRHRINMTNIAIKIDTY